MTLMQAMQQTDIKDVHAMQLYNHLASCSSVGNLPAIRQVAMIEARKQELYCKAKVNTYDVSAELLSLIALQQKLLQSLPHERNGAPNEPQRSDQTLMCPGT